MLGIATLHIICTLIFVKFYGVAQAEIPLLLGGYGFGASFVALFMQLGGGIYTKAPAVGADLVGDMVGDCVGSSADVFESVGAEIIGAMILGGVLAQEAKIENP